MRIHIFIAVDRKITTSHDTYGEKQETEEGCSRADFIFEEAFVPHILQCNGLLNFGTCLAKLNNLPFVFLVYRRPVLYCTVLHCTELCCTVL